MRILFTWHAAVEPQYRKLFRELALSGHELTVITPTSWFESGRLQSVSAEESDGYRLIPLKIVFRDRLKAFFYPEVGKVISVLRGFRPDIVHIFEEPYTLSCFQFTALSRLFCPGVKIVVESFENISMRQGFPFSSVEKYTLKRADSLVAIPAEGESLWEDKGYRKKIIRVPVGLDEKLFRKTDGTVAGYEFLDAKKGVRIAYVGRLTRDKGVDLLLEAFASLSGLSVRTELLVVGSGEKDYFKGLAAGLGLGDSVRFVDAVPSELLPALYSKTDILVLPSRTTAGWKEQFGRVLVEAMACGSVVVGSDSGEIPFVIGDAGIVFREGDMEGLAVALKRLVADERLRRSFSEAGRKRVLENFTWEKVAKKLIKVYDDLIKKKA